MPYIYLITISEDGELKKRLYKSTVFHNEIDFRNIFKIKTYGFIWKKVSKDELEMVEREFNKF